MKIGVIGWGLRSSLGRTAHQPEKGYEVVALADPSPIAREKFEADIPGAKAYATVDEMLAVGINAVFILSPDHFHEEHATLTLRAGLPTYLEKPMAITTEGCDRVLQVASDTGTRLYVGHNMRHFDVFKKMKEWILAGHIGEVKTAWCRHFVSYGGEAYFRDWHADRTKSTGLLLQKGAHDIDVLHWLCAGYSTKVSALGAIMVYGDNKNRAEVGERVPIEFTTTFPASTLQKVYPIVDVEDVSMMLMELNNGVLASYQQCHFTPDGWRNYTIIGTEGRLENFGDMPGKATVKLWNTRKDAYRTESDMSYDVPETTGGHGGADDLAVAEFFKFAEEGAATLTSPVAGRFAVAAGIAATQSIRQGGGAVEVPALSDELMKLE